jgi:hypothetical protein
MAADKIVKASCKNGERNVKGLMCFKHTGITQSVLNHFQIAIRKHAVLLSLTAG